MRVRNREGTARVWMYRNVLSEDPGGAPYVLGHAIDITERVVAERTLRESEQALRLAHGELEARVRERTAALERANERLRVEIAERERAEQLRERSLIEQRDTLAFLATFSDGLAPILTFDELVDVLCRQPAPFPGDWTAVHVLNEDGSARPHPSGHVDPAREEVLTRLAASAGAVPAGSLMVAVVAGPPVSVANSASQDLAAQLGGPGGTAAVLQELSAASVAALPLVMDGRAKAVLFLVSENPTRFTGAGAMVVEDLARRIRLALDRIQLHREAQDANRLKDEFLSTLSHELRTPLNAIFGWARMLRMRDLDAKTAHGVSVIERNAEAQIRLIEEVLDVSRIMTGKMTLAMESIDLRSAVRAAIDALRPARAGQEGPAHRVPRRRRATHFRRRTQASTGVLERAVECREVHRRRRIDYGEPEECRSDGRGRNYRHRRGHSSRRSAVYLRSVSPGRFIDDANARGPRPRSRHRQAHRRAARRDREGGKRRRRARLNVHHPASRCRSRWRRRSFHALRRPPAIGSGAPMLLAGCTVLVVEDHDDARELIAAVLERCGRSNRQRILDAGGPRTCGRDQTRRVDRRHRAAWRRRLCSVATDSSAPWPRPAGNRAHRLRPHCRPRTRPRRRIPAARRQTHRPSEARRDRRIDNSTAITENSPIRSANGDTASRCSCARIDAGGTASMRGCRWSKRCGGGFSASRK